MKITLVGLGPKADTVTVGGAKAIKNAEKVICRTALAASSQFLKDNGIEAEYLDYMFESSRSFSSLCKKIAKHVLDASKSCDVVYCVDGSVHDDNSCGIILERHKDVVVFEGVSHAAEALKTFCAGGYTAVSAHSDGKFGRAFLRPFVLYDLDCALLASEWKLKLTDAFGDDAPALLYISGGKKEINLYELDMQEGYAYDTVLIVPGQDFLHKQRFCIDDLFDIVEALRAENGCPWDRVQTRNSIRDNLIEESYELYDAIINGDMEGITEELGDLLLQIAFHCIFGEENHEYNRGDAISGICHKLISRHTHVFGSDKAGSGGEALAVWEKNKGVEKGYENAYAYVAGVPRSFPALMRAQKLQKRAAKYNFDFSDVKDVYNKVSEEFSEVREAAAEDSKEHLGEEIGDLLFSVVNLARTYGINAEEALRFSADKFQTRFKKLEEAILADGKNMKDLDEAELDKYYNEIKKS